MKKLSLIFIAAAAFLFTACEYNEENFSGLDTVSRPTNVTIIDYTLTDTDYTTIANTAGGDAGDFIKNNKYFNETYLVADYAVHLLNNTNAPAEMRYADANSAVKLTFKYLEPNDTLPGSSLTILSRETLSPDNYKEMGSQANQPGQYSNFSSSINPDVFLPHWLQVKYPIAYKGDIRMIRYVFFMGSALGSETRFGLYMYNGEAWQPYTHTEQFIKGSNGKWLFDPAVSITMTRADYQLIVTRVLEDPVLGVYQYNTPRTNEEWYFGFNAYYDNINMRPEGGTTSCRDGITSSLEHDTVLHSLGSYDEKMDLLWKRLNEEGMPLFLQTKYPEAVAEVSGITVNYKITAKVYFGPSSADAKMYTWTYKTLTSGTTGTPPTFEFIEVIEQ